MGGAESKRQEFFDALHKGENIDVIEKAKKDLADADDTFNFFTVRDQYERNALAVVIKALSANDPPAKRTNHLAFIEKYYRDFDLNLASPSSRQTLLHFLCSVSAGHYHAPPPDSVIGTPDERNHPYHYDPRTKQDAELHKVLGDLAEKFLAEGANHNVKDLSERTPLMQAASGGLVFVVRELCGAGADVNFLTARGESPLLFACLSGSVDSVSQILPLCKSELKLNSYYNNVAVGFEAQQQLQQQQQQQQRVVARRPLGIALEFGRVDLFEFLVKNNFDLSEMYQLRSLLGDPSSKKAQRWDYKPPKHNPYSLKVLFKSFFDGITFYDNEGYDPFRNAFPKEAEVSSTFAGRELFAACIGNSLAQAALLRSFGAFAILVEQYDPRLPCDKFPKRASILHLVASFKVDTTQKHDNAIDFVDAIRDKRAKLSADGQYDWNVKDDDGATPLDYCMRANEVSRHREEEAPAPPRRRRRVVVVSKPFTALIFIETFKFYPPEEMDIELVIERGDWGNARHSGARTRGAREQGHAHLVCAL